MGVTLMERGLPLSTALLMGALCLLVMGSGAAQAADQTGPTFNAVFIDLQGLETPVTNLLFYWEEKLNETQLALHELKHVPAQRGTVPIQINFSRIQRIDFRAGSGGKQPVLSVTLKNGKKGDFTLEIPGSFKGQTDFGDMIAKPTQLKGIIFQ